MRCRECGAPTRVAATREAGDGFALQRDRRCQNGHRYFTLEVDDGLGKTISKYALRAERIKGIHARVDRWARNIEIWRRGKTEKHSALGQEFGLSDNMISTIAKTKP